jgi:hypothetical protein
VSQKPHCHEPASSLAKSTHKATRGSPNVLVPLAERSWVPPVVKPEPLLPVDPSEIVNKTKQDEADDQGDLEHRTGQLDLAKDPDKEDVGRKRDDCCECSPLLTLPDSPMQTAIQIPAFRSVQ